MKLIISVYLTDKKVWAAMEPSIEEQINRVLAEGA